MIEVTSITEKHDADDDDDVDYDEADANHDDTNDSVSALNTTSGDGITVSSINTSQIACLTSPF